MASIRQISLLVLIALVGQSKPAGLCAAASAPASLSARGVVFHDRNQNGTRDDGEEGLSGMRVSNGLEVAVTDDQGNWRLPAGEDVIFFLIKPRGWMTPLSADRLPRFYYVHKPAGSPQLEYAGVEPTGPLPDSIDFPLHPQPEPNSFSIVVTADPQARNERELEYIAHDVLAELHGIDAVFGVTLGDIVDNTLSLFPALNACFGTVGIPWYNVMGNHDTNQDATCDQHSDETFESHFGPSYYSFDYGPVHFLVLDNINWLGRPKNKTASYRGGFGSRQLEFIRNDLAHVPAEQLVVLMMHIPLDGVDDREELFRLIEKRPHTFSLSGHTHAQHHCFLGSEDGWRGDRPHHHLVNAVISGSHYGGVPDELGIPHATMYDGAPNGYSIISFDGHRYRVRFKAARRRADYQMNIYTPFTVAAQDALLTEVVVNVFGGSERSTVEMRLGQGGDWIPMEHELREDPAFQELKRAEEAQKLPGKALQRIKPSPHIWSARLPEATAPGTYLIQVRTTDMFGQSDQACRIIQIR